MLSRIICAVLLCFAAAASAEGLAPNAEERLTFVFGPYVYHYHYDPLHNNYPWLTGLEWGPRGSWVDYGAVYFENSFDQPSVYAYVGKRWFVADEHKGLYLKLTAGPLYGYRDPYEDKVPFNHNGLAFAIIPGIGYQYRRVDAHVVFLGGAALLFTFGYDFPR